MSIFRSALVLAALLSACGTAEEPVSSLEPRYGTASTTSTVEPVAYTSTPYDFTGPTPIADLYDLIDANLGGARVWFATAPSAPFPFDGACDTFGTQVESLSELPAEIEGIVTLHPRYFLNLSFCQSEERFYGSYFIQDQSGGILVLKDSRISDFRMGDRVRLKANSLVYNFGAYAVMGRVDEEVVSRGHEVYAEFIGDRLLTPDDVGKTVTIRRELASGATNYNFSELCLVPVGSDYSACDPRCVANEQCLGSLLVSLDREIEQRDPVILSPGDVLEITGPVTNSFGIRILVARAGQIKFVEE